MSRKAETFSEEDLMGIVSAMAEVDESFAVNIDPNRYNIWDHGMVIAIRLYTRSGRVTADLAFADGTFSTVDWEKPSVRNYWITGIRALTYIYDDRIIETCQKEFVKHIVGADNKRKYLKAHPNQSVKNVFLEGERRRRARRQRMIKDKTYAYYRKNIGNDISVINALGDGFSAISRIYKVINRKDDTKKEYSVLDSATCLEDILEYIKTLQIAAKHKKFISNAFKAYHQLQFDTISEEEVNFKIETQYDDDDTEDAIDETTEEDSSSEE